MSNVPELRFSEFSDEWKENKLGETLKILHGKSQKGIENTNGMYPILGTGGEIGRTNEYLCDWDCVLIGRKGTIDKPFYMDKPFWTVDTLFYTKPEKEYLPLFQYFLFQTINWKKYNEASGVPSLSAKTIRSIKKKFPSYKEQQKIADFLSILDSRIEIQEKTIKSIEEMKKGYMQKIFSREIKFKDGDGEEYPEWEVKKLGDISKVITGNSNVEDNISNGKYRFFDRGMDSIKYLNDYLLEAEAIIYPGEGSKFLPRYYNGKFALHQRCYAIYDFYDNCSVRYIYNYMQTLSNYFVRYSVGSTVPSLRQENFINCKISLPCLEEQQKIASFLSTFDEKLEIEEQILEILKDIKKGLLQRMFV